MSGFEVAELPADTVVAGRYRIRRPLGHGGTATAYLVEDQLHRADVVLKLLDAQRTEFVHVLRAEFLRLSALHHPHLPLVYDFGATRIDGRAAAAADDRSPHESALADGDPFLVSGSGDGRHRCYYTTEWIDGAPINVFIEGKPSAVLRPLFADLLDALSFLHRVGLVHGDVKPANVLVRVVGDAPQAVLIDLGCARPIGTPSDGRVWGTPAFMAPELLRDQPASVQSDLFAVGATLLRLAETVEGGLPADLWALAGRLTATDTGTRPADVAECLEALGQGRPIRPLPLGQSPHLFGRSSVLGHFDRALENLIAGGPRLRALCVYGDEGVGKSRLLREMKWRAQSVCGVVEAIAERPGGISDAIRRVACCEPLPPGIAGLVAARAALAVVDDAQVVILDDLHRAPTEERALFSALLRSLPTDSPILFLCASDTPLGAGDAAHDEHIAPLDAPAVRSWAQGMVSDAGLVQVMRVTGGLPSELVTLFAQMGAADDSGRDLGRLLAVSTLSERRLRAIAELSPSQRDLLATVAAVDGRLSDGDARRFRELAVHVGELLGRGLLVRETVGFRLTIPSEATAVGRALDGSAVAESPHDDAIVAVQGSTGRRALGSSPTAMQRAHRRWADVRASELASISEGASPGRGAALATSALRASIAHHRAMAGDGIGASRALLAEVSRAAGDGCVRAHPIDPHAWCRVVDDLLGSSTVGRAPRGRPGRAWGRTVLAAAEMLEHAGRSERAKAMLMGFVGDHGSHIQSAQRAEVHQRLAACELRGGFAEAAMSQLDAAEAAWPSNDVRAASKRPRVDGLRLLQQRADLRSRALIRAGDFAAAERIASAALAEVGPLPEAATPQSPALLARLHEDIGVAKSYRGEHAAAAEHLGRATALHEEGGDTRARVRTLSYAAINAYRAGDLGTAKAGHRRALRCAEEAGHSDQIAPVALNLGAACQKSGDWGDALRCYERARETAMALDQAGTHATARFNLAKLYADIGVFDRADRLAAEIAPSVDGVGDAGDCLSPLAAAAASVRAAVAIALGQHRQAAEWLRCAERAFARSQAKRESAEVQIERAELEMERGDVEAMRSLLESAATVADAGLDDLRARILLLRGRATLRRTPSGGEELEANRSLPLSRSDEGVAEARALFEQARELAAACDEKDLAAEVELWLSKTWRALGAHTVADAHLSGAKELWERIAATLPEELRAGFWRHPRRLATGSVHGAMPSQTAGDPPAVDAERVRKLERLLLINRQLGSLDVAALLREIMDGAIELTGAERGFVILNRDSRDRRDEGPEERFEVVAARNLDREKVGKSHLKFSRTIAEQVIRGGEPMVTFDAQSDGRFGANASIHAMRLRSVIAVPIAGVADDDAPIGALYLDNRFKTSLFAEDDVGLLVAFAVQASVALRNARLHAELERRTEELLRERERIATLLKGQTTQIEELSRAVDSQRRVLERRYDYGVMVAKSAGMQRLLAMLDRVIDSDLSVLIEGESGTGKELVARALHFNGGRSVGPFVTVNCAALPENLLESELFGHVKGAFTGADRDRMGLMVEAQGGTLFLDEIGELPLAMQAKLLRALQEREVRPVGAQHAVPVDFRLVAATNRDLSEEVGCGRFREDLYYRVGVVEAVVPPLRDRALDLPDLVLQVLREQEKLVGKAGLTIAPRALRSLLTAPWPGNVRQLENAISRAVVMDEDGVIDGDDLALEKPRARSRTAGSRRESRDQEAIAMRSALSQAEWNVSEAARQIGMPRASFYRKMRRYQIA